MARGPNGSHNGSGNGSGHDPEDGKIASLADARKRQAERAKAAEKAKRDQARSSSLDRRPRTWKDWVGGILLIAMALGMIASWALPLLSR